MKLITVFFLILSALTSAHAGEVLVLGNNPWPPFVVEGDERGTAEQLVFQALERSGWTCTVQIQEWEAVLDAARTGAIDGIIATWYSPEREEYLLFSEPYMTNRIVAVVNDSNPADIQSVADLAGKKVAILADYAYGGDIEAMADHFTVIHATDSLEALKAVQSGVADLALVEELVARNALEASMISGVSLSGNVLATRDLYFAVAKANPNAREIINDFQRSFQAMLSDGTVNEILNIDWLATDFGHLGRTDVVLRSGVTLDQLTHPSEEGSVYTMGTSSYQYTDQPEQDNSRVNYQVGGKSHSSLQQALNSAFGEEIGCEHTEFSSEFDCTNMFKKKQ